MTLNKLLAGAAMAALLSGAASAQSAFVDASSDFKPVSVIANEGGQDLDGNLVLSFDIANVFSTMGAGGAVDLQITVNGAVFSGVVLPNSLTNVAGGPACTFSTSPTLGGGSGANSVTYSSAGQINICGALGEIQVTLPIFVDFGDTISVSAVFTATADAQGYGPVVNTSIDAEDIIVYGDALSYAFTPGAVANGELNTAGDGFLNPGPGDGIIGILDTDYDGTLFYNATQTLNAAGITADDLAASGEVTVSFTDATGILAVTLDAAPCTPAGNDFTCAVDTTNIADQEIIFTLVGALEPTVSQIPTASLALTADAGANPSAAVFDGLAATALTPIALDNGRAVTAITTSAFRWVKVGSGGTESNFRIAFPSEAQANAVENVRVVVAAGNGVGAKTIVLSKGTTAATGFQVQGATVTFNSRALGAASGDDGNADVTSIDLDHDETALLPLAVQGLSVKRQLVNRNPGSFVATPGLE
jgi:hypothetical protein